MTHTHTHTHTYTHTHTHTHIHTHTHTYTHTHTHGLSLLHSLVTHSLTSSLFLPLTAEEGPIRTEK